MARPNIKNTTKILKRDGRKYRSINATLTDAEMNEIKSAFYVVRGMTGLPLSLADTMRSVLRFSLLQNRAALVDSIKREAIKND